MRADRLGAFANVYGPEGEWVRLFRHDPDYLRTILLRDQKDPQRFVTVDFWTSRQAHEGFRERLRANFEALDRQCEALTEREAHLGDFDLEE